MDVREIAMLAREKGSIRACDVPRNAVLDLQVGGRLVKMCFGEDPSSGMVTVQSDPGEDWVIWLHLTDGWGSTAGPYSSSGLEHELIPGCRFYVGPFFFPVIEKVVLQGMDLADPSASQKQ
jgi:hypothetical protein